MTNVLQWNGDISVTGRYLRGGVALPPWDAADVASDLAEGRTVTTLDEYFANNASYNVLDYGAKGDGVTDDTAAFQAAINAAIAAQGGELLQPEPPFDSHGMRLFYRINGTLTLAPAPGTSQAWFSWNARGVYAAVRYFGPSNASVVVCKGLKLVDIKGVRISIQGAGNVCVWDMRCVVGAASTSNVAFRDCLVEFGTGGANRGWRAVPGPGGMGDFANIAFHNCVGVGAGRVYGDVCWHAGTSNAEPWFWYNSGCSGVGIGVVDGPLVAVMSAGISATDTTVTVDTTLAHPPTGTIEIELEQMSYTGKTATSFTGLTRGVNGTTAAAHGTQNIVYERPTGAQFQMIGAAEKYFFGCGLGGNSIDFALTGTGNYGLVGGRFEDSTQWMRLGTGGVSRISLTLMGTSVAGQYQNPLITSRAPVSIYAVNPSWISNAVDFDAGMLSVNVDPSTYSSIEIIGGQIKGADPCMTIAGSAGHVYKSMRGVLRLDSTYQAVGYFA